MSIASSQCPTGRARPMSSSACGDELDAWPPGEACDIGGAAGPMTGIVWQVDLEEQRVLAVSPRWGDVDCLGGG